MWWAVTHDYQGTGLTFPQGLLLLLVLRIYGEVFVVGLGWVNLVHFGGEAQGR